jgi:hypothetical protein
VLGKRRRKGKQKEFHSHSHIYNRLASHLSREKKKFTQYNLPSLARIKKEIFTHNKENFLHLLFHDSSFSHLWKFFLYLHYYTRRESNKNQTDTKNYLLCQAAFTWKNENSQAWVNVAGRFKLQKLSRDWWRMHTRERRRRNLKEVTHVLWRLSSSPSFKKKYIKNFSSSFLRFVLCFSSLLFSHISKKK